MPKFSTRSLSRLLGDCVECLRRLGILIVAVAKLLWHKLRRTCRKFASRHTLNRRSLTRLWLHFLILLRHIGRRSASLARSSAHRIRTFRFQSKHYLALFFLIVLVLFVFRLFHPDVVSRPEPTASDLQPAHPADTHSPFTRMPDSISVHALLTDSLLRLPHVLNSDLTQASSGKRHKIYSVSSYQRCFPDVNDVQLATASRLGITPATDRLEAEQSMHRLVYIGLNPYYDVAPLHHSIPYLIPKAQLLLSKIARNFLDSQYVKHIPPSKILVTSVTRTGEDISSLSKRNFNSTPNSCHAYATTFDISYLRYSPQQDPDAPPVRPTRNDTLKYVLSEVLNDLRRQGLCYVKYEGKQSCFHITVR